MNIPPNQDDLTDVGFGKMDAAKQCKQKTYTIEEFKNYLLSQDSFGDVLYYLNEENIEKANDNNKNEDLYD